MKSHREKLDIEACVVFLLLEDMESTATTGKKIYKVYVGKGNLLWKWFQKLEVDIFFESTKSIEWEVITDNLYTEKFWGNKTTSDLFNSNLNS